MLRIIGGKYRGKKLLSTTNQDIRPTKSLVREALFNILTSKYEKFSDLKVADICCGSGAFGIESLSRGACLVDFVDKSKDHLKIVANNLKNIDGNYNIFNLDALHLKPVEESYDIIFLDPPYDIGQENKIMSDLLTKGWMSSKTLLIYEARSSKKISLGEEFLLIDERRYGKSKIFFINLKKILI